MDHELSFLKRLHHPNVVSYIHHEIPYDDGKELYIWTELCEYGDLGSFAKASGTGKTRY